MTQTNVPETTNPTPPRRMWFGEAPTHCQICRIALTPQTDTIRDPQTNEVIEVFVDAPSILGPWAIQCLACHSILFERRQNLARFTGRDPDAVKLFGTGIGQAYRVDTLEKVGG